MSTLQSHPGSFCLGRHRCRLTPSARWIFSRNCSVGGGGSDRPLTVKRSFHLLPDKARTSPVFMRWTETDRVNGCPIFWWMTFRRLWRERCLWERPFSVNPEEIVGFGTMAMVQDPVNVVFALWQSRQDRRWHRPRYGVVSWNELITDQTEKAREFYTKMFGWTCSQTDLESSSTPSL